MVLNIVESELDRRQSELWPTAREWLTEGELAGLLQCSPDTLRTYALREEHPLPYGKVGVLRRYHREDVDRWPRDEGLRDRDQRLSGEKSKGKKCGQKSKGGS